MPANVDGMVREGISAYRAGRKDEARALLLRAVEIDQFNEQAWLWLSAVVESVDEQRTCLENVLTINPNNERAKQGLQMLSQKSGSAVSSKSASAQADDVLASASFTATPPPPPANPISADDDELPTTIEWDAPPTASSSASSSRPVNEPSAAEYDDWVSNLNLGSGSSSQANTLDAAAQFMSTPFDDDEDDLFSSDTSVSLDDDLFSSGPFDAPEVAAPNRQPDIAPRPTAPAQVPARMTSDSLLDEIEEDEIVGSGFFDDDDDELEFDKLDASEYFQFIPKEIKATRLPGTRERYPAVVIVGLIALFLLNIGAVALLVTNLTK